jgi:hypothetical protein
MWTMEPERELTIVRISFNLSPQERQVLCVVSLSKTATFSARNKSMIAPQSAAKNDSPGAGKNQRDYWARNHFRPERCLPASRLPVGGFALRHLMAKVMRDQCRNAGGP